MRKTLDDVDGFVYSAPASSPPRGRPMTNYIGVTCSVRVYRGTGQCPACRWKVVDVSSNEVPEPWASRMVERGFTDPRYNDDRPSLSALRDASGVHVSTISNAIRGKRTPSAGTISALVAVLGDDVAGWLGSVAVSPWTPPAEASLLTDRQRKAVEEIIRAMTEHRQEVGNDARSAANRQAAERAANIEALRGPDPSVLDLAAETEERRREE